MSALAPTEVTEPTPEQTIALLQAQLAASQDALAAASAPAPKAPSAFKTKIKKIGRGIWAAVASTDAVKREKSLGALIVTRILINLGASAATVDLVRIGLKALGVNF